MFDFTNLVFNLRCSEMVEFSFALKASSIASEFGLL